MCRRNVRPVCLHIHVCFSLRGFISDGSFSRAEQINMTWLAEKAILAGNMKPSFDHQLASAQQPVRVCSERCERVQYPLDLHASSTASSGCKHIYLLKRCPHLIVTVALRCWTHFYPPPPHPPSTQETSAESRMFLDSSVTPVKSKTSLVDRSSMITLCTPVNHSPESQFSVGELDETAGKKKKPYFKSLVGMCESNYKCSTC